MKNTDDGTLSLFGDELPPAPATAPTPKPAKAPAEKKPRAKRKPKESVAASNETNVGVEKAVEAEVLGQPNPLVLLAAVEPQPRRNSPWAAVTQAKTELQNTAAEVVNPIEAQTVTPHKPHVMMVITKGEAGGAQSHVLALCEALRNDIHFTVVIGGPTEGSVLAQQLRALGVTVCPLPQMVESLLPWRLWPAVQGLVALIAAHPPDLIHTHSAIAGLTARLASQRTERPVVYTVHGFGFKPQVPWLRRHMANLAERAMAGWTTQMICVSEHERELAYQLRIHHERVHVIPNGIALQTQTISTDKSGEALLAPDSPHQRPPHGWHHRPIQTARPFTHHLPPTCHASSWWHA